MVQSAESGEYLFPARGEQDMNDPCVVRAAGAIHQIRGLGPVDQLDNAVVAQLKTVGELGHAGPVAARETLQRQQQLVLLRRESITTYGLLAEAEVGADRETERRQCLEVALGQRSVGLGGLGGHRLSIS